jgi:Protease inhibitor Inh
MFDDAAFCHAGRALSTPWHRPAQFLKFVLWMRAKNQDNKIAVTSNLHNLRGNWRQKMKNAWHVWLAVAIGGISGCTSAGPSSSVPQAQVATPAPFGTASGATPQPVAKPAVAQAMSKTTTTEKTTVSADGSTVTTEKTTMSVGFDPVAAQKALVAPVAAAANAGIPGSWKLQSSSSKAICDVSLSGAPASVSGEAATNCAAFSSMKGVSGWRYANGSLELLRGAEVAVAFQQSGPSRFDGQYSAMGLTTTLALYR